MYKTYLKRGIDLVISLATFILISPLFVLLCLLVRIFIGKPIFFRQTRTTKNKKKFDIIKFRTMTNDRDERGEYLSDEKRLTKVGRLLRTSSLDELPELINIIRGDMSIIGPRPLPASYLNYYREDEMARFEVRGGLIPPDSVDLSAVISWDQQFKYEENYGKNVSFGMDIKILIGAFRIIFQRGKTDYGSFVRLPLNVERKNMNNDK